MHWTTCIQRNGRLPDPLAPSAGGYDEDEDNEDNEVNDDMIMIIIIIMVIGVTIMKMRGQPDVHGGIACMHSSRAR